MKQFFKYVFATMVGLFFSFIVFGILMVMLIAGLAASLDKKEVKVTSGSILELNLDYDIPERTPDNPFAEIFMSENGDIKLGLDDLLANIKKAQTDANIKGILLRTSINSSGFSTVEEVRNALLEFKKSGKFIYAFGTYFDEKNYFMASVADSVFLDRNGEVVLNGLASNVTFLKGTLDKLGVEMELVKVGKYKGAGEALTRTDLSPENKEQITQYLNGIYNHIMGAIAVSRHKDIAELNNLFNTFAIQSGLQAVQKGMIDRLLYEDQLISLLKKKAGIKEEDKLHLIAGGKYKNSGSQKSENEGGKDKIAVIYAVGDIIDGEGDDNMIGSETMSKAIRKAREDKNVKAIVLRINSPGGSASASDKIWRELELCKGKKPVIVSMSDVAASGGYYIAAGADSIIAMPTTITGSIGVFGIIPNMQVLLHDKLGLSFETVKTGEFSDFGRTDRAMTPAERQIVQNMVDRIYDDFTGVVERGRGLDSTTVENIAQGRVWYAGDAKNIKLIDSYGGIEEAVKIAAFKANISKYRIVNYPKSDSPFKKFFGGMSAAFAAKVKSDEMGDFYPYYLKMKQISRVKGIQMRIPFILENF